MKRFLVIILCLAMLVTAFACTKNGSTNGSGSANNGKDAAPSPTPELKTITGYMTIAEYGKVEFEVYPQYAPQSALNFVYLAQNGCFNGVIFDRIQKGVTLEAGKYLQAYELVKFPDDQEYTIKGEFRNNNVQNPLSVAEGMLVWSRDSKDPDSAANEFMICLDTARCQGLEGNYAPFGKITKGMDILKKIAKKQKVDEYQRPTGKPAIILVCQIDGDTIWPAPDKIIKNKSDKAN